MLRNFINLKENIFGEDQTFTDMGTSNSKSHVNNVSQLQTKIQSLSTKEETAKSISEISLTAEEKPKTFDPRLYRPLEVVVSLTIHDIQAHLVKVTDYPANDTHRVNFIAKIFICRIAMKTIHRARLYSSSAWDSR